MAEGLKIVEGDFIITNKAVVTIEGVEKSKRDFYKMLVTDKENVNNETSYNRYNPNFGTELNRLEIYKNLPLDTVIDVMSASLKEAIEAYVKLEESRANLTTNEIISDIVFIVYADPTDRTKIKISIEGKTPTYESIDLGNFVQRFI